MQGKFQFVFLSACLFLISTVNSEKCSYTEALPDDYPCYTADDITSWMKVIAKYGCSGTANATQMLGYFNCIEKVAKDYIPTVVTHVMLTPLQCGEKLIDNMELLKNPSPLEGMNLFCKTMPGPDEEIKPSSKGFKLMSCVMYEYFRKYKLEAQDNKIFKC